MGQRKFNKCVCSAAKWLGCYQHTLNNIWKRPRVGDTWLLGADTARQPEAPSLPDLVRVMGFATTRDAIGLPRALCPLAISAGLFPEPNAAWQIQIGKIQGDMGHFLKQVQLTVASQITRAFISCLRMVKSESPWAASSRVWCFKEEKTMGLPPMHPTTRVQMGRNKCKQCTGFHLLRAGARGSSFPTRPHRGNLSFQGMKFYWFKIYSFHSQILK